MRTLWNTLLRQWLDAEGDDAGVERLSGHLRRDTGLDGGLDGAEADFLPAQNIRERNLSDARSFLTLQAYR
ncbi:hypothetical protein [Roseomonas genomospecies 6]|uniref:Uncharacterized protein n=1 Tax=Roseomonas genomospecies 6 TaxID=214106 RepID=A0A9W7U065_9PROT|nr:hypothetical protein [Roseomonas genomospecies 6]KAA0682800.1 hypothetical protein DS843_05130 [Roseomonas genomospecies 6]